MSYEITNECIIEEYLNNWFTYEELAQYLCIDVDKVMHTLNNIEDEKLLKKIVHHKELIDMYYSSDDEIKPLEGYVEILLIADYIIKTHSSIRQTAQFFGIGKTTVLDKIHEKLPYISIRKYKEVFDVLMENKSFNTNNKEVIDQIVICYNLITNGISSQEICEKLGIGRNVLQRNLTTRLRKINKQKADEVSLILKDNQLQNLHPFKSI